jgi:hypothetical protein
MSRERRLTAPAVVIDKHDARDPHGDETRLLHCVTLTFTEDVSAIRHLSRHTGRVKNLSLEDHRYTFSLPGGILQQDPWPTPCERFQPVLSARRDDACPAEWLAHSESSSSLPER